MVFSALAIACTTVAWISAVVMSGLVMPDPALAHSKGLYATEAEARERVNQPGGGIPQFLDADVRSVAGGRRVCSAR